MAPSTFTSGPTTKNFEKDSTSVIQPTQKEINEQKRLTRLYFKEQAEVLKPQVELSELRARYSKAVFENYYYSTELHRIQAAEEEAKKEHEESKSTEHIVTKEDLVNNPDLKEQGISEGETIGIPSETPVVPINKNLDVVND